MPKIEYNQRGTPRWFAVAHHRALSRYVHLFETDGARPGAGSATTACGVSPFSLYPSIGEIEFVVPDDDWERCPACAATLEVT